MAAIVWDADGQRFYENGVDRGVLYTKTEAEGAYATGVPWNGLTAVNESPSGAESNDMYADNIKYGSIRSAETFGATIEAYTYPSEFEVCDGSKEVAKGVTIGQQDRAAFGFCYRTNIGSDASSNAGYKLHIVYNATAAPSEKNYETVNDSPEATTMSWEIETTPVTVTGHKPTSKLTINSTKADPVKLKALEDKLYGTLEGEPTLPSPDEIIAMMGDEE